MSDDRDIPHGPIGWVSQETHEALGKSKMNVIGNMRETITTLRQQVTTAQAENEALRAEADEARSKYVHNLKSFQSAAIAICQQESEEWDSDRLQTHKDYAEVCGQRIAGLSLVTARAWLLRQKAEAVEQIGSDIGELPFIAKNRGEVNGFNMSAQACGEYAQRLRTQAAELERQSEGGE